MNRRNHRKYWKENENIEKGTETAGATGQSAAVHKRYSFLRLGINDWMLSCIFHHNICCYSVWKQTLDLLLYVCVSFPSVFFSSFVAQFIVKLCYVLGGYISEDFDKKVSNPCFTSPRTKYDRKLFHVFSYIISKCKIEWYPEVFFKKITLEGCMEKLKTAPVANLRGSTLRNFMRSF